MSSEFPLLNWLHEQFSNQLHNKQETLRVVTVTMICSKLASLWKLQ